MSDLPIIMTSAGAQPTPPKTLLSTLISNVAQKVPGYTANLPAGLITDLASTATGALALIDQARVDLINSVSPYGANEALLLQLGSIYGVTASSGSNTSVYIVFNGPAGFVIPKGFVVSDGNFQYSVQTNTIIPSSGQSTPVYCLATSPGTWAVPEGSVTEIITSVPASQPVTCTNPTAGLPGSDKQDIASYRAQVLQSGMFAVQGTPDCTLAALKSVEGTKDNLISYRQVQTDKWVVVVGGGDPFEVGYAIYQSVPDISRLTNDVVNPSGAPVDKRTVQITVWPDVYDVPYVEPVSQNAQVFIEWNTVSTAYVDPAGVKNAVSQNIVDYINGIPVGQPINIFEIQDIFLRSVSALVPPTLVSMINIEMGINGSIAPPDAGTNLVYGDTYKYFSTSAALIQVTKHGDTGP
ncbi:baseplate J/gp47 family protein [Rahnella aceris]|uniref:baseplate J/gp47 family protein n=1 Tax=Rahnella sp. (strain Y9602) TaxID=2703885 RepID=UPI0019054606|nr:baseplate J/gp47 family protein [Rahnella aceris]QQN36603.1 baseplate J/gp47 family protein [Rahnella aceris]